MLKGFAAGGIPKRYDCPFHTLLAYCDCFQRTAGKADRHCRSWKQSTGLVKYPDDISDDEIVNLNIPKGVPLFTNWTRL